MLSSVVPETNKSEAGHMIMSLPELRLPAGDQPNKEAAARWRAAHALRSCSGRGAVPTVGNEQQREGHTAFTLAASLCIIHLPSPWRRCDAVCEET